MATVVVGLLFVVLCGVLAVALNQRDEAREECKRMDVEIDDLIAACETNSNTIAELIKELEEANADTRIRSLQEQVSALIDERDQLRLQVEQNDDQWTFDGQPMDSTTLGEAFRKQVNEMADRHDFVGAVEPSGNVEGA